MKTPPPPPLPCNGRAPVRLQQFFNPIMLFTFILLYGCGTVLIREARVRWNLQWVWTIQLTLYHATVSTLIPIAIVDLAWPQYRNVPLLKKRGLVLASAGLAFITLIGMAFIGTMVEGTMVPFHPLLLIVGFLVALVTGAVLPLILLTPVHELVPGVNPDQAGGMMLVGIVALVLLVRWRKKVFGEDDKNRD